ncbi:uncharacterized protein LOC135137576 isoform X2 [Zophobas morio]|uniref:uncharacterized protein LOC135137576 isoform X2 n=1 Tax=Zophobas morio TaxID=2755281 RepID=UPI003083BA9A
MCRLKIISVCLISLILTHHALNKEISYNEDTDFLRESIKRFGPPHPLNFENCSLPGPEISTYKDLVQENIFTNESGTYTLKFWTVTDDFSYINRYEVRETKIINDEEIIAIKGQFTEKIPRKQAGFFLRTVGFVNDETSYRLFLLDVTKITTNLKKKFKIPISGGCGSLIRRSLLQPCALAFLVGLHMYQ